MKAPKVLSVALLAAGILILGSAAPAMAADSYGGAGTPISIYTYNYPRTGYLPSPPASVPASSTITAVSYNLNWSSFGYPTGNMNASLCSSSTNCTVASRYGGSTSFFNGLPATTGLYFEATWWHPYLQGTIAGGPIEVETSVSVNYN